MAGMPVDSNNRMSELVAAWFRPGCRLVCQEKDRDRYGRTVAICRANGEDLGAILVREGMAWAFVRYSSDYVGQEAKAKADRLGIHAYDCQPAWEWRAQQRTRNAK
jgi:endonuclease YncB( thermonuclease family)